MGYLGYQKYLKSNQSKQSSHSEEDKYDKHPLLLSVVLKTLFKFIGNSPSDLASCRVVCSAWKNASFNQWRNCAYLTLTQNDIYEDGATALATTTENLGGLSSSQFIRYFTNDDFQLRTKPFKNYKLKGWSLDNGLGLTRILNDFWSSIGPHIKHIRLENCYNKTTIPEHFYKLIFQLLPSLEGLVLVNNRFHFPETNEKDRAALEVKKYARSNFYMNASLMNLELDGWTPFYFWKLEQPLFPNLRHVTLKMIDYSNTLDNEGVADSLTTFSDERLHLETINLLFGSLEYVEFYVMFKPMLDINRRSLKNFTLYRRYGAEPYPDMVWPIIFNSMEGITLHGNVVLSFKFMEYSPNMQRVHIDRSGYEIWDGVESKGVHCKKMESYTWNMTRMPAIVMNGLKSIHIDLKITIEGLYALCGVSPALKSFYLIADNEELSTVLKMWPGLEELGLLYGSNVDDDGIIQVGKGENTRIGLRHFSLETKCNEAKLSDKAIYGGFLTWNSLLNIKLCVSEQMTKEATESLKSRVFTMTIIRNYGTEHYGECCRRKRFLKIP